MKRLLFLLALAVLPVFAAEDYVPFRPDLPAGAAYTLDARQLHPTQMAIGWREVVFKQKTIDGKSPAELVTYRKDKDVPVVIGPDGVPYMTDGHHTMRALIESKSADKLAYGHILANWSDLTPAEFWARMEAKKWVYLKDAAAKPVTVAQLPADLRHMQLDPYRGLGWGLLKAGAYEEKKDIFFQEFLWGDRFRGKVTWNDKDDADFARAVKESAALARTEAFADLPGYKGAVKPLVAAEAGK